jgi:hypothetical protein
MGINVLVAGIVTPQARRWRSCVAAFNGARVQSENAISDLIVTGGLLLQKRNVRIGKRCRSLAQFRRHQMLLLLAARARA